jgi:hypothetical protein
MYIIMGVSIPSHDNNLPLQVDKRVREAWFKIMSRVNLWPPE